MISLLLLAGLVQPVPAKPVSLTLSPMPSGLFKRLGGYRPLAIQLSEGIPQELVKAPEGAVRYGVLTFGKHHVLVATGDNTLFVDANGDGDLTNDPAPVWKIDPASRKGGKPYHSGTFRVPLLIQGETVACEFGVYETDRPDILGAYADFAMVGKMALGSNSYDVIYSDLTATWDGTQGDLMIDTDGDGKLHPGYEFYTVDKPFNVKGTTYEIRSQAGLPVVFKSSSVVKERTKADSVPPDPNLGNGLLPGKLALPFQAKTMSGKNVAFPTSYKGKIVLIDFWATWCGPCMREVPNVVSAYQKYHKQGFEVLGVSLDREKAEGQIKAVTTNRRMPWEQIYDGKYFDAKIARQYSIKAIPATYLVDGDTGKILAAGEGAREKQLALSIEKALATKQANRRAAK